MGTFLQRGLLLILDNLREAIDILKSMQGKAIDLKAAIPIDNAFVVETFKDMCDKISTIQDRAVNGQAQSDMFSSAPLSKVIQQWERLSETSMSSLSHTLTASKFSL